MLSDRLDPGLECDDGRGGAGLYVATCGVLVFISLLLAMYHIEERCIWFDEAATWMNSSSSWKQAIIYMIRGEDCGGFVYGVMSKLWTSVFGFSEAALRIPSALAAAGMTAVMIRIGWLTEGRRFSLCCGLLAAAHPVAIEYSREARAYMLEALLVAICLLGVVLYERRGYRGGSLLLAVSASLLVVTHVFGAFVVAGLLLYLGAIVMTTGATWRVARPLLPAVVITLLWGCLLRARITHNLNEFWIRGSIAENYAATIATYLPLPWVSLPLFVLGVALFWRSENARARLLGGLVAATTCTVMLGPGVVSLLSRGDHNFILPRYFMPLTPLAVFPLAFACSRWSRWPTTVAVVSLAAAWLSMVNYPAVYGPVGPDGDVRAAARWLREHARSQDRVFVIPHFQVITLAYYGVDQMCSIEGADSPRLFDELAARENSVTRGRPFVVVCRRSENAGASNAARSPKWKRHEFENLDLFEWVLEEVDSDVERGSE